MSIGEEQSLKSASGDKRPSGVWLLLAMVVLAAGLAPIGLAAFVTDIPAMGQAMPAILPSWVATVGAAVLVLYTRSVKIASTIVFTICGLAILNLGGCAFEFARLDRALG